MEFLTAGNIAALAAAVLLLAPASQAQTAVAQSGWQAVDPAHALDDDNPSSAQALGFADQLQNKGFHQFCDNIPLEASISHNDGLFQSREQGKGGLQIGGAIDAGRSFYHYPTGDLALIDRAAVNLSLGDSKKLISAAHAMPLGLILTSRAEGESFVIRPLEKNRSCEDLGKLINLTGFKTVLPLNAQRIAGMKVGELWKFPLRIQMSVGPEVGGSPAGPAFNSAFFLTLTYSKMRAAMATIYRMEPRKVRVRLRIERAEVWDAAGTSIASPLPILLAGKPEGARILRHVMPSFLAGFVVDQAADYLNQYLAAIVTASPWSRSDGNQAILEYVLDPEDAGQMEGLERALKGDLGPLTLLSALAKLSRPYDPQAQAGLDLLRDLERRNTASIGSTPAYAGAAHRSGRHNRHLRVKLPLVIDYDRSSGQVRSDIVVLGSADGRLRQWSAFRQSSRSFMDIPFMGQMGRSQGQRGVQATVRLDAGGSASAPVVVYTQQEGFLRGDENAGRRLFEKADDVARRIGEAARQDTAIPAPPLPARQAGAKAGRYTANAALTVVLGPKALEEILRSSPEQIVAAYARSLNGSAREAMEAVLASGRVKDDGRIVDPAALFTGGGPMAELAERLSLQASGLIRDLGQARALSDPQQRANKLVEIISGRGASRLAYEATMKVLVQLAGPDNVGAEFWVFLIDRQGSGKSVASRYLYNPGLFQDPLLKESSRASRRFMQPLKPTD